MASQCGSQRPDETTCRWIRQEHFPVITVIQDCLPGARGSELVALSMADHNLIFSRLPSGAKHVSIRLVPKFIPKNARLDTITKPLEFPGIAHLFSIDPERLLCPIRTLGLYIVRSQELADEEPQQKLFVHFTPKTQLFTTHFRRWVA